MPGHWDQRSGIASLNTPAHGARVIASIAFRNFKALRNTRVALAPFNLVIGPNGSGKTSLIEALVRLRTLSQLPPASPVSWEQKTGGPEIEFTFSPPHDGLTVQLGCRSEDVCDALRTNPAGAAGWPELQKQLSTVRAYTLDHRRMAVPAQRSSP